MTKILKICSKIGLIIAMIITVYSVSPSTEIQATDELNPGQARVDKYATLVDGLVNTWDIVLRVEGRDLKKTTKSVLVLDTSGSMQGNKLRDAKTAAKLFVDTVLSAENNAGGNNQVALVTFAENAVTLVNFTTNANTLKDEINNLSATGGTFTQAGIRLGNELLAESSADFKNIILLSDGEPTYSYRVKNYEDYSDQVGTGPNAYYVTSKNVPYEEFDEDDRVGTGSSLTQRIGWFGNYYYHNGNSAIAEGGFFKALNSGGSHSLYSIALEVSTTGQQILKEIGSPGKYYASNSAGLSEIFKQIAEGINAAVKNATIVDPMGQGFEVQGVVSDIQISPNGGTVALDGNTINWDIPVLSEPISAGSDIKYAEIKYRITINDDILNVEPDAEDTYPTNGLTTIQYTDYQGATKTINFPVPKVDPVFVHVDKDLVDQNGQVIVDTDRIFDVKLSHTNGYDENTQVKAGQRVTLTTLRKVDNGYVVLETGSNDGTVNDASFSDYTIRYFVGGVETDKFNVIKKTDSVKDAMDDIYVVVENKYTIPMTSITAKKQWEGGDPENRPDIEFQLFRKVGNGTPEAVGDSVILNGTETPVWNYTWNNLPAKTPQGKNYTYYVDELNVPEFYEKIVVDNLKIKNKFVPGITSVTAQKIWDGGVANNRPEVSFQLYQQVGNEDPVVIGTPVTLDGTESNPWHVTFTGLVTHRQSDGKLYKYFVREVNVPENFEADDVDNLVVTNTYVSPKIDITGNKVWVNGPQERPTIQLQLFRNGSAHLAPVTLTSGQLVHTWTGLDKTDFNGVDYVYTVDEVAVPDNYSKSIDGLTITNTYGSPKTTVNGYKQWVGGPTIKPTIELQLYRNNEALGDPVSLANGVTSYAWTGLDKTDLNGVDYTYRVDEVTVPTNYEKSISQDGFTVINTYKSPKIDITGTKVWVNGPEVKPTIELQLFKDGVAFGDPVELVHGQLVHTWTNLDKTDSNGVEHVYTVDEVAVPTNFEKSIDGFTITNTYKSPKIDITGTKLWFGGPEDRPTIELQLFRDGVEFGAPVELVSGETTHTWNDLDKTAPNGDVYVYTVDEVEVPENYTKSISQNGLIVSNTYVSPKIEIMGTKVWVDGPQERPTIELQLFKDGVAFGEPVELVHGELVHTWTNLDKTDSNGVDHVYTVDEVEVPDNYEKSVDGLTITNTYKSPKIDITGTKEWLGGSDDRPTIELQLYRDGVALGDSVELLSGDTTHTWTGLDRTDSDGNDYIYTVDEINVPDNYEKVAIGLKVTNTYVSPKIDITGTKVWVNGPEVKPTIQLQLFRNGVAHLLPVTLVNGQTTHTWTNLDKTDFDGDDYIYTVDEVAVPANFEKSVEGLVVTNTYVSPKISVHGIKEWIGGPAIKPTVQLQLFRNNIAFGNPVTLVDPGTSFTWTELDKTDLNGIDYTYRVDEVAVPENYEKNISQDGFMVTNTYISPKIDITGTKVWVNGPHVKPTIELQLFRDGIAHLSPVTLVSGQTSHTWSDLDKTDFNGINYVYTVDEVNVPTNFEKSIEGIVITNTYVSPKIDITGTKEWVGGPQLRPTIELQLFRDGVEFEDPIVLVSGETTHTWTELDKTNEFGVDYLYTVDEVNVPANYQKTVDGLKVTNSYVSPKIDITGTKLWFGGPEDKPTIELQLFRDGIAFGAPVELVSGETTHTWSELDKTDLSGVDYVYTVDEVEVPENYTKSISQNGLIVSNTYVSPKIDITGTKVWVDGPEDRPIIELQLFRDGEAFGEPVELTEGMLSHTWSDLDKTDKYGDDYVYTVDEVNVPENYEKSVDGFVVTNSYVSPKIDIIGTKTWINGPQDRPTIELQLLRDGIAFGAPVELVSGETTHTWYDLDKTDLNGVDYVYTVDEVNVPANYQKTVDGLKVTNSYVSPKIDITGTKLWFGGLEDRPTIELQLFRDGVEFGAPVELVSGETTHTWSELDKTDLSGVDYVYTVDEVEVPENYTKSISQNGLIVSNTYVSPKIDIIGTKVWVDGPEDRPIIELQLFRDGEAFGEPVELTEGMLSHTWSDLDKTDFEGVEYVYTVDEVNVPENYEKSVDGFVVTNSYVSPKIDITGTKVWVNGPSVKPTIELQLFRDGEALGEPVELVDGVTSYTWLDLDKTDAMGVDYVYTIDEVEVVENFEKTVEGLEVTNTYVSPLIDITMTKVWVGEIEEFPTIQIQLFRNGEAFGAPIELVDGATSATWTDLDMTDENGVDYVYTVEEVEIPAGYFRIIDGLTITNVLIELPDTGGEDPIIKLPDTGGMNGQMFMIFGAGVTLVGALIAIRKRKEDEEE